MFSSKTPLRVSFFGGGTDLSSFYKNNKYGHVISTNIDQYIYVNLRVMNEIFYEKYRLSYSKTEICKNINDIENSIIKNVFKYFSLNESIYLSTIADVPASTGLGSSSAFCVGLLETIFKLKNIKYNNKKLAEIAALIEVLKLKKPIGIQDHYAAAYPGFKYIRFNNDNSVSVKRIKMNKNISEIFDSMLFFWTKIQRSTDTILSEQNKNYKKNNNYLNSIKDITTEIYKNIRKESLSLNYFAEAMNESWFLKQKLSSNISNNFLNEVYENAIKNRALGGKLLGAGGGGFFIFLAKKKDHPKLISSMKKNGLQFCKFNFLN